MNHSNNDGASSAESEEGRLPIKENTLPFDTYPTQSGTARVTRVGECAANRYGGPLLTRDKEPDARMSARPGLCGGCVRKMRNRHAVRKMEVDPPEPPCRRRFQTAISCFGPKGRGGERYG
jgi:hypothetical protein